MLEFQAVVMAGGRGSRLPDIPGAPPKCLLPVGPYPLVWYSLNLLERQGFQDVMLIVLDNEKLEIQKAVEKLALKIKVEYFTIPFEKDLGTADSLRSIHEHIVTDLVVLSCDFVSDVDLDYVIYMYRKHDASVVSMLFDNGPQEYIQVPGPKSKEKPERDLIGLDKETNRMVFLASASDFDEFVDLPRALLKKHPALSLHSRLLDSHVYVLKKWLVDFLYDDQQLTTIKGELLPHIIKKQLSKPVKRLDEKLNSVAHIDLRKDIFRFTSNEGNNKKIREVSTFNDHASGMKACYHDDLIRCYAYIPPKDSFAIRVNTLSAFCLINSKIVKTWDNIVKKQSLVRIHPGSDVKSNQIDEECIVGDQTIVSEKTSIKSTIIGAHCKINNKVRLTNCILMNNVTVKEGCNLQDCIIYPEAIIEAECTLKLCIVGTQHEVPPKTDAVQQIYSEANENMITLG